MNSRSRALDGLRGIAALAVIFYHAILHHEVLVGTVLVQPIQDFASSRNVITKILLMIFNGHSAVMLFFVLSGFVLTLSLDRMKGTASDVLTRFVVRRAFRLYPALFVAMAFYWAMSVVYATLGWYGFPAPDFLRAMTNATLFDITWHGPSRTIQGEVLAIPFVLALFGLYRLVGVPALFVGLGYSIMAMTNPAMVLWAPNMMGWLLAFAAGMLLAQPGFAVVFAKVTTPGVVLLAIAFVALRGFVPGSDNATVVGITILAMALVGAIHYGNNAAVDRLLNRQAPQFLGRISFSLYLLNVPFLLVAWSITDQFPWFTRHAWEAGLIVGSIVAAATVPLAWIVTRKVEEPLMDLGRTLTEKRTTPLLSTTAEPA